MRCAALNYASHSHYNDHLAPICYAMEVPLVVVEKHDYEMSQKLYQDIDVHLIDYEKFNPEYLIQNYDALFMSDLWDRDVLREKFAPLEKKYGKKIRNVHVPHGFSDKGFYLRKVAKEDIALIYGQNMLDMLKHEGVLHLLNNYVITGNLRYRYYKKNEAFFDNYVKNVVLQGLDLEKKTILYAPTWVDLEETSTYFECIDFVLSNVPQEFNIIVKPHPQLELDDTISYYRVLGKYQNHPQVRFITDFFVIYPLLKQTDIYLGDMSSIGYDFLIFNRPMFFLNKDNRNSKKDRRSYLFKCGIDIKKNQFSKLYEIILENLEKDAERFKNIRKEVYEYTFGQEKEFEAIKSAILSVISENIS